MVAFLEKPTESSGLEEIVDFLNAHLIRYALNVNPTIYVSCIEQFWSIAKTKTINGETHIHALVDGKKIVITESSVRKVLQFANEDGIDCLPKTTNFDNLNLMGYENLSDKLTFYKCFFSHQWKFLVHTILQCLSPKKTAWNKFSSNIASAIICLATNQKFNFSKMVFDGMTRNLDSLYTKFLMYPRFLQVFLDKQLDKVPSHNVIFSVPCHTKKVFANMKRTGKDFSGKVTPLFDTMLIQNQADVGEGSGHPTDPQHTPKSDQPSITEQIISQSSHQPKKTHKPKKPKSNVIQIPQSGKPIKPVADEAVLKERGDCLERAATTASSLKAEQVVVPGAKAPWGTQLLKLEKKGGSRTHKFKRLYKVGRSARMISSNEASLGDQEDASKQGRKINDIDKYAEITLVDEAQGRYGDNLIFDIVSTADPVTNVSVKVTIASATTTTNDDLTLAQTLMEIRSARPKAKGVVFREQGESTTITIRPQQEPLKDKGKGIMEEPEKPTKRKDQIRHDEEVAQRLQAQMQAELEEEDMLVR
ncbi:hypothetical protein Tco_1381933 [Tanacetum coccineum]